MSEVDIAMPCYNSAPWLDGMIQSILAQEGPAWRIVARDDGSTDETAQRLLAWRDKLGERMVVLENPTRENLRIAASYTAVLRATTAPFVLTADPDDIWLPGHLDRVVETMRRAQSRAGAHVPQAVCTNAIVVDESGNHLEPSYWRWVRSSPRRGKHVRQVAMENPALGSTMGINRALLDLALPIPRESGAQDWWLALAASAFGRLTAIEEVSILYRRHGGNHMKDPFGASILGAVRLTLSAPAKARERVRALLFNRIASQAGVFVARYGDRLGAEDAEALRALADLPRQGPAARRRTLVGQGFGFASRVKTVGAWVLC